MAEVLQYDSAFIFSLRYNNHEKLPSNVWDKIQSYKISRYSRGRPGRFNSFMINRNPDQLGTEEAKKHFRKQVTGLLNKITVDNCDKLIAQLDTHLSVIENIQTSLNREDKKELHKSIMSILMDKAITEMAFSELYAKVLLKMIEKIDIDYIDYLDNLLIDIKKNHIQKTKSFYNIVDYEKFCQLVSDKKKYIGLFHFLGQLYLKNLLSETDSKKYVMYLFNNIIKSDKKLELQIEINAHSLKNFLEVCNEKKFYDIVMEKFNLLQNDKEYKIKMRFIIMDIVDNFKKF